LQANKDVKKDLTKYVADALAENKPAKEIINEVKEYSVKYSLVEYEVVTIVSGSVKIFNHLAVVLLKCRFLILVILNSSYRRSGQH
jgi:hypothetical protein